MCSDKLLIECFEAYSEAKNYKIQINGFYRMTFFFLLLIRGEISMKNFPQKKMKPNKMVIIRQPKDDLGAMTNALEF